MTNDARALRFDIRHVEIQSEQQERREQLDREFAALRERLQPQET